jgi:hypothetical protein
VVETDDYVLIGGLSDLPAGNYVVNATIFNEIYSTESSLHTADIDCKTEVNGQRADIGRASGGTVIREKDWAPHTDVFALPLPAGSTIHVSCRLFDGGDAALGQVRVTATQVNAIN